MWPELHLPLASDRHLIVATHGLLVVLAVVAGMVVTARRSERPAAALAIAATVAAAALAGAHALFASVHGGPFGLRLGGLTSTGGVVAGLGATWAIARLTGSAPGRLYDAIVPAGLIALGIGRLGCFLGGCCPGRPSDVPWALVVPTFGGAPRHPLPLYSAVLDFGVAAAAMRLGGAPGRTALHALVGFASGRFVLEFLRDPVATDPLPGGVTLAQMLCLLLLAAACVLYRCSPAGGLPKADSRLRLGARMRNRLPIIVLLALALGWPVDAPATEGSFAAFLGVRPAKGKLDESRGLGSLEVRRWRFRASSFSDGIDPANERVVISIGDRTQFVLPAGALVASKNGRRFRHVDKGVTQGIKKLTLKRKRDGAYLVWFSLEGVVMDQLLVQYPFCDTFSLEVGNDEAFSGIDLDRPRGERSPRVKLRGFCEPDACRDALRTSPLGGAPGITAQHSVCPNLEL